jgi:hypothetical protein
MSNWPKNAQACASCTGSPERYPHGARGNCARCYTIMRYIRDVKAWNRNKPETLKHIPEDGTRVESHGRLVRTGRLLTAIYNAEQFEKVRREYIRQLEGRLALFLLREQIRRCEFPVQGLDIEEKREQLLTAMRGVPRRTRANYPANASHINLHFDEAQRRVLYALLEEVIECAQWRGIDWGLVARCAHVPEA